MWFSLFIVSSIVNLLAFLYIRWLLKVMATINQDIDGVSLLIRDFAEHTKSIYELEMFYGDETLKALMEHASQISRQLSDLDLVLNEELEESELGTEED